MNSGHWAVQQIELVGCSFPYQISAVPKNSRIIIWFLLCDLHCNVWWTAPIKFTVTEWFSFCCQCCFHHWEQPDLIRQMVSAKTTFTFSGGCRVKKVAADYMYVLVVTCRFLWATSSCRSVTSWALGSITILLTFHGLTYSLYFQVHAFLGLFWFGFFEKKVSKNKFWKLTLHYEKNRPIRNLRSTNGWFAVCVLCHY